MRKDRVTNKPGERKPYMALYAEGITAQLRGDLTHAGVTNTIVNSLGELLHRIAAGGEKDFRIDCRRIRAIDLSGLQLLYVWMQCARFRGVEPELINIPANLQQAIREMELDHHFTGTSASL
jgi:ABC-type transporter Mla MlaB component